jgi:signal transduction histidine kinase
VRATANPPALVAAEVLGDRLQSYFELLATALGPAATKLERRFLGRLPRESYDPKQRKALAALTPWAAAQLLSSGRPAKDFIEQVEYHGRRLAKLNLAPGLVVRALEECDRLLGPPGAWFTAAGEAKLNAALDQWRFCTILTLNNAFQQVAEAETMAYQELFRIELESRSMDELLLRMLETLSQFCRSQAGALYVHDPETSSWILKAATSGGKPGPHGPERIACTRGSRRRWSQPRCSAARDGGEQWTLSSGWRGLYRTCWSVPLTIGGNTAGVAQFGFIKPYEWLPRELELLLAAAERCSLAAEKARLIEDLAAREDQVRGLAERLIQVEDRERRRISGELHDEAGQSLLCIRLQLEILERSLPAACAHLAAGLAETRALTEKTIVEIRRLISSLSPAVLDQLGLAAALRQLAARFQRLHKIPVRLHLGPAGDLDPQIASAVYRLVQECLNNVAKHSSASCVNLFLHSADKELRLRVEDNGIGYRAEDAQDKRESFGLAGMRERVSLLGGNFHIDGRPGRGTRVRIELPARARRGPSGPGR